MAASLAQTAESPGQTPAEAPRRTGARHLRLWRAIAVAVVALGCAGSLIGARAVGNETLARSHRSFAATSADVRSALQLALQQESDLNLGVGALLMDKPDITNQEFLRWTTNAQAFTRYPGLVGFGFTAIVPSAQLRRFATHAVTDPAGALGLDGSFQVVPPGVRPFYCFALVGATRPGAANLPAGYDFCAADPSLQSRDSGIGNYSPLALGGQQLLAIQTPMYRGGRVPVSLAARRAAFTGWVGVLTSPGLLLSRAVAGHPGTAVAFAFHPGRSDATFRVGSVPRHSQHIVQDLNNGWIVTTYGSVPVGLFAGSTTAFTVAFGGTALFLLLALLIYVLATGRSRAFALVTEKTAQLQHQALHDTLTDLPNRALIMDRLDRMLARSRRDRLTMATLFVDLDEFKIVNDTLGHAAGDRLLQAVAARLRSTLRDADTIGRLGGDEFVVLIDGNASPLAPELVAERVLSVMREPFDLGSAKPVTVTASIGIAVGANASASDLLRQADMALYRAKSVGRNCFEVFREEIGSEANHRYELEIDLRTALDEHQFRLVYQPIYNLSDLSVIGVEALLRWDHPSRGSVQPDEFIPSLEQSGQIVDVGRWVLAEACAQMASWRARGSDLIVSVNVSARQLEHDAVVRDVSDALATSGLEPSALTIEITETALMRDVETTARRLAAVKALGVQIAIDDFGTGYSSLSYLQRLPVDCLKIDRSFTEAISRSPESDALIRTLVHLGKSLGLTTLAEGVETTAQIDHLRGEGVSEVQGFLLAKPLDPQSVETLFLPAATASADAQSK